MKIRTHDQTFETSTACIQKGDWFLENELIVRRCTHRGPTKTIAGYEWDDVIWEGDTCYAPDDCIRLTLIPKP